MGKRAKKKKKSAHKAGTGEGEGGDRAWRHSFDVADPPSRFVLLTRWHFFLEDVVM